MIDTLPPPREYFAITDGRHVHDVFWLYLTTLDYELLMAALEHFGGDKAKAARALGYGRRELESKLRCYGIQGKRRGYHARAARAQLVHDIRRRFRCKPVKNQQN